MLRVAVLLRPLICAGTCTTTVSGDVGQTCSYSDGGAPAEGGAFHGACMAACACTSGMGAPSERCTDQIGRIACDNRIR